MDALGWGLMGAALLVIAALATVLIKTERDKRRLLTDLEALLTDPDQPPRFILL